ncbi:MAG: zf-HC2 domain-containing protein [Pirellulaceae bacterium]|nr:zf-HC2 domain-containing protein [Pirellulaceae bacterium]
MNQRDELSDELLSAYLDGELSGDERREVERLLSEDPARRQALEELQALSGGFQSLPRYELAEDFYQRVLAVAEQRSLAGDEEEAGEDLRASETAERRPAAVLSGAEALETEPAVRGGFVRPLVYAVLAVAAAVLVMISGREPDRRPAVPDGPSVTSVEPADGPGEAGRAVPGEPGSLRSAEEQPALVASDEPAAATDQAAAVAATGRPGERSTSGEPDQTARAGAEPPQVATNNSSADGAGDKPAASRDRNPPDQVAGVANSPPRDLVPEPQMPQIVDAQGLLQYLLVIDVELTAEGARNNLFRNSLRGHGIRFGDDMQVNSELEEAMLSSRLLARVEGAPGDQRRPGEFVYVVATGQQIDSMVRHLGTSGQVHRLHYDVGFKPAQLDVFRKLRLADARDRKVQAELLSGLGRARRLVLDLAVLSPAARQLSGHSLLAPETGEEQWLLPLAGKPRVGDEKAPLGTNEIFEVLFLVRGGA